MVLIEAATAGNEKEVEECAVVFKEHANKLVEVSENVLSVELQTLKIDLLFFLGRIVCIKVLGKGKTKTKQTKKQNSNAKSSDYHRTISLIFENFLYR